MNPRTVVTGLGFITCIGNDSQSVLTSLASLETGISEHAFFGNERLPVKVVGKPAEFELDGSNWRKWRIPEQYSIEQSLRRSLSPHAIYSVCAVEQALRDAGLEKEDLQSGDTGLYCASAGSPLFLYENLDTLRKNKGERGNPLGVLSSIAGTLNFNLGSWLGIKGTNCGYVSACASSTHAIGYAFDDIALGRQKRAIIIGAEDPTAESLMPFMSMRALSINPDPRSASRPFDEHRDGFVGAGGATVLILEEESHARRRGAKTYAEIAGWGQSSDGFHRASPHPEGHGLASAIEKAIASAGATIEDIDYINAHATSTQVGDIAETLAIRNVFKQRASNIPVSSVKGITGHSLSMAGALETAICALSLDKRILPGNANLEEVDPQCQHLLLPRQTEEKPLTWVLNNSSGFGGSNVCNVLKRYAPA